MRILSCFLFAAIAATAETATAPPPLALEGRLMGHARVPALQQRQHVSMDACPTRTPSPVAAAVEEKLKSLGYDPNNRDRPLLVSLGDNFAPEHDARMMGAREAKDLLFWYRRQWWNLTKTDAATTQALAGYEQHIENPGLGSVPFDNAACFFKRLGYSATVPGKHDFHYGAERLRQYARLLFDNGVEMLAAPRQALKFPYPATVK